MTADVQLKVSNRKTGLPIVRATFNLIQKELQRGDTLCLVGDSEDGRRVSIQIRAAAIEEVPPTPFEDAPSRLPGQATLEFVATRSPNAPARL